MKYIAKSRGYINDRIVNPGESFEAEGFKGSWAVPAKEYEPEVEEKTETQLAEEAVEGLQGSKKKKTKKKAAKKKVAKKK